MDRAANIAQVFRTLCWETNTSPLSCWVGTGAAELILAILLLVPARTFPS